MSESPKYYLHGEGELPVSIGLPREAIEGFAKTVAGRIPAGRFGQPEEVAKAVAFLASNDSSFVIGSEITTDGGLMLNRL